MGLFSRPKCQIHGVEYSIGTNGLADYYYCKHCRNKSRGENAEKKLKDKEIDELKKRLEALETKLNK